MILAAAVNANKNLKWLNGTAGDMLPFIQILLLRLIYQPSSAQTTQTSIQSVHWNFSTQWCSVFNHILQWNQITKQTRTTNRSLGVVVDMVGSRGTVLMLLVYSTNRQTEQTKVGAYLWTYIARTAFHYTLLISLSSLTPSPAPPSNYPTFTRSLSQPIFQEYTQFKPRYYITIRCFHISWPIH